MSDFLGLKDRVALITGAGQGLGRAYALAYAQAGAVPIIADIDAKKAATVADELRSLGKDSLAIEVDVASEHSVADMTARVLDRFGRIDILVNNAAIFSTLKMRPFEEIPLDEWRRVIDVNVTGCFLTSKSVAAPMREAGWGRVIHISSAAWSMGRGNYLHYTTSKAALLGMTRSMARELGTHGITVNAILPGATHTEVSRETVSPDQMNAFLAQRSIPRLETPDDLCGALLFLSSDASGFVTGQTLTVDGGLSYE
ncbi:SDR family NAD(P)-dependent oxidoreductase [Antarcticirhabdus aurantiaca]|uniref:SDR family NAD(P)-dependent oxidoreductase n=1 Tax=Antarcticirhabdus aurantiaca TaxID=2606717 RepID=UPI00131C3015|nr:3-oxoacyl-ACP reductase family protein [Antarcticirhabdus aurantiaca]